MKTTVCLWALAVSLMFQAHAESNTTNILDGVATNVAGPFTLGDTGPFNFLLITNGGVLTSTTGTVGNTLDAHSNLSVVTGTNSVWHNTSNLFVGVTGAMNRVSVLDGGSLNVRLQSFIGFDLSSSNNLVSAAGSNTFLDMQWFHLGQAGSGNQLLVSRGARSGRFVSRDVINNIGFLPTSSDNLLMVQDSGTRWITDGFRVGYHGSRNRAVLRDGATLTIGSLTVGRESSSMENVVEVSGAGSFWEVQDSFTVFIGFNGSSNKLMVADGARFQTPRATIGVSNAATFNVAALRGPGTVWANPNSIIVGDQGPGNALNATDRAALFIGRLDIGARSSSNQVVIESGAQVINTILPNANASLVLGSSFGANDNVLQLQNPGTIWSNSGYILIGGSGARNSMTLSDGASLIDTRVGSGGIVLGDTSSGSDNRLLLTGANTLFHSRYVMTIGRSGSGSRLLVSEGARLVTASADIGQTCIARDNIAFITGVGSVWSNGMLQVGFCSTNNHLVVSNGAQVFAGLVRSSVQGGASNSFTVTGAGSFLRASGDLIIGNSGQANSLLIADGGRAEGRNDRIGLGGGNNVAFLRGAGSSWSNRSLTIGDTTGGSHLMLSDGARVDSGGAILGADAKSYGNKAFLSGANTAWNITTNLTLGGLGRSNELSVSIGANVSAGNVYLGAGSLLNPSALYNSDWNFARIEGTNSVLSVSSNLVVGAYGRFNRLEISSGAQVHDSDGVIGLASGSRSNSVLISGPGSNWDNANSLLVGSNGTSSELVVAQGGRARSATGVIGAGGNLTGGGSVCSYFEGGNRVLITDPGSRWENTGPVYIGSGSVGNSLVVSNGGVVTASGLLLGATNGIAPGSVCSPHSPLNQVVIQGGFLAVTNADESARLETRFGTYRQQSGIVLVDILTCTNGPLSRVDLLGGTLRVKWGRIQNGSPLVVGDGLRNAHLEFADPPYWGAVKFRSDDGIVVQPHARLSGVGTIDASVTNAGTISPGGARPGSLSLTRLSCLSQSRLHIDIAGRLGEERDYLSLSFASTLDGSLTVTLRNGFVPSASDTFQILGGPVPFSGGFANVPFGSRLKTADNLGSFLVISNANRVELRDFQSTDLDGDTIEDVWATDHFGHSPLTPAEKLADADGDGLSNYDEFRAGTDPNDPASALQLSIAYSSGTATMSFPCVEAKEYRVWSSNDLEAWNEVSDPTFAFPSPGNCEWADDGKDSGVLGVASRFYRVTVE